MWQRNRAMPQWKMSCNSEIDNIESTHPGYDEYRYDLDTIGHNPHELSVLLDRPFAELHPAERTGRAKTCLFGLQYTLTLTEEIEIRTTTDEDRATEEDTTNTVS